MATIKGITIQFDGDTTKLGQALKQIDSQTRSLDKDLKQVNNALKFNPKNTELLAQKQQLLGQKIGETRKRLDALKAAQAKMDDDPSVDKQSQEYMQLRREIITTESKLKHFIEQSKELSKVKFEQVGSQITAVGDKMQSVGKGLTKYVTAPILGVGAAAGKAFQEVDEGMDIIAQKTGATGKALKGMEDSAKNIATSIPTDFATAGAAVGEVNTRFGTTGKALEDLSAQFVKFAQINNTDVSTSIDLTQKAMEAFGMDASQAGSMLDILNKAGQDTGISVDALAQSMVTNAAALQGMGLNAQQSAGFLGQLEKSGVDSQKVMTGLQKALVNGAKAGKTMPQVMQQIQTSIVSAKSDTEAMTAAAELFGAKAGPAIATAARNGALDFNALANASMNAAGSVTNTFNTTLDPIDKFQLLANQLKITLAEIAVPIMEMLAPALTALATKIQELTAKWQSLSPETQSFIVKVAGIAAAVGPALIIFGKLATGLGSIITIIPKIVSGFGAIGKAFGVVSKALMANPWAIVAAAAVAAIVLIVKNWDAIKEFFAKLWENIKQIAIKAWTAIKTAIMTPINAVKNAIAKVWNGIKTATANVWNGIKGAVSKAVNAVKTVITTVWGTVRNTTTKVWEGIKGAITKPIEKARDVIKKIIDKIKGFFKFDFELPKIKLPHFKIKPTGWKFRDLLKGDIPKLSIEWYKSGGIFNSPSVIGVGEAGPEAVLPIEKLNGMLAGMADSIVNGILAGQGMQAAAGDITIPIYLYPSGAKMGEETVKMYDIYKKQLG